MLLKLLPFFVAALTSPAIAEEDTTQTSSLPISSLFSLTVRDIWIPSQWQSKSKTNIAELRPLIPFTIGEQVNIMRFSVPYRTRSASGSGLGDVRAFDLVSFRLDHGLWGIGPVVNLRTNAVQGSDTIQGGFVLGVVEIKKRLAFGLLNQNLFSNQVSTSTIQPILIYPFRERWTIGLGDLPFVFNWRSLSRVFVPIGFQLGFQIGATQQSLRIFVNPQYNTRNIQQVPQWTLTTGFTLPVIPLPTKSAKKDRTVRPIVSNV